MQALETKLPTLEEFANLSRIKRVKAVIETFGLIDVVFTSSFGIDSALMPELISQACLKIPALHLNTGYIFPETYRHRQTLVEVYDLNLYEYGPSEDTKRYITSNMLWKRNPAEYSELTKEEPLKRAVRGLGISAVFMSLRRYQTINRAGKPFYEQGPYGELRIYPLLDMTMDEADEWFDAFDLPRHPLQARGYESVGDWHSTQPGTGRTGRDESVCQLNVVKAAV